MDNEIYFYKASLLTEDDYFKFNRTGKSVCLDNPYWTLSTNDDRHHSPAFINSVGFWNQYEIELTDELEIHPVISMIYAVSNPIGKIMSFGNIINVADMPFMVLDSKRLLSLQSIGTGQFYTVESKADMLMDGLIYENSDVKEIVDDWFNHFLKKVVFKPDFSHKKINLKLYKGI